MEKYYIIISTVRSNFEGNIGFLTSKKRLNVTLTRPKKGIIIIGNCKCLSKRSKIWRDLVDFYASKNLIIDEEGNALRKEFIMSKERHFDDCDGKDEEIREKKKK